MMAAREDEENAENLAENNNFLNLNVLRKALTFLES
jgi:hypothetical protein